MLMTWKKKNLFQILMSVKVKIRLFGNAEGLLHGTRKEEMYIYKA